ncbi:MAG: hypothetical protein AB1806_06820 [Acidobacteriota bacterium]
MTALAAFIIAFAASAGTGALVRRVALSHGAVVPARAERWHRQPTPTFGGIAIATGTLGVTVGLVLWYQSDAAVPTALLVAAAAAVMFVVGLIDDQLPLMPLAKLLAALATGAFLLFGLAAASHVNLNWWATVLAVIWFAGIVHAFNLLDNMDGLAGGVALISGLCLALVYSGDLPALLMAVLMAYAGGVAGFLVWNVRPARLFMGDCGSLLLGAVVAGTSLALLHRPAASFGLDGLILCLILVVPLFDTSFVLVLRRLAGRPASRGGTDHLSHRLVSVGLSERSAVSALYVLALAGGGCAYAVRAGGVSSAPLGVLFVTGVLLLGIYLARVPAYAGEDFRALQKSTYAPFLKDITFRWHALEMLLDVILISVVYYLSYRLRFEDERLEVFIFSFTNSLPVVLGCKLVALHVSGAYSPMWGTFSVRDLFTIVRGVLMGSVASVLAAAYLYRFERFSRGVFIIDAALLILVLVAARGSFRVLGEAVLSRSARGRRVLIYGAGSGGQLLVREMQANAEWAMRPVAFLDDDPVKLGRRLLGVPVKGGSEGIEDLIRRHRVEEVVLSTSKIHPDKERLVRDTCSRLGLRVRRFRLVISE